uniref:ATP synthase subunit epsilon, mitochondrial n=1 Tax=Laticauda laticaudata TaxID=8630 RepID=A0A8C5S9Q2_LATLA
MTSPFPFPLFYSLDDIYFNLFPNPCVAGLSIFYIRYSQICAQAVRAALKPQFKTEAEKAAGSHVKIIKPKKE